MKITSKMFEKSLYNIGAGYDIEPLLRLTHLTGTFIYVNLGLKKEKVVDWYEKAFKYSNDLEILQKTVYDDFDELDYFEMHSDYKNHLSTPGFISAQDLQNYLGTFRNQLNEKQFGIHYKLKRRSLNREIDLFFLTCEGLASYISLSHNGKYAPEILCTIQTGMLEHPEGIMNKMLSQPNYRLPSIWIRGFEPKYSFMNERNNSLNELGSFNKKIMDFNQTWGCGRSYPEQKFLKRYCRGFTNQSQFEILKNMNLKKDFNMGKDKIVSGSISDHIVKFNRSDWIIISESLRSKLKIEHPNIIFLSDFIPKKKLWHPSHTDVSKQIDSLRKLINKKKISKDALLHIIPFFNEDEGVLYMNSIQRLNNMTCTYINNLYDLIDLKEVTR